MGGFRKLEVAAASCGVKLTAPQLEQVGEYLLLLAKWNQRISLTSVTDADELLRFHFLEAFWTAAAFLGRAGSVADIGSGAGFPGMPIQIYRPQLRVSLIEPNYKKFLFLEELGKVLALPVETFHGSGEDFPAWDRIDVAVIRALRPSSRLLECLASNDVSLLLLCGQRSPGIDGWQVIRRERYPFSRNRWAIHYRCFT